MIRAYGMSLGKATPGIYYSCLDKRAWLVLFRTFFAVYIISVPALAARFRDHSNFLFSGWSTTHGCLRFSVTNSSLIPRNEIPYNSPKKASIPTIKDNG
jgi:hypothetical protein